MKKVTFLEPPAVTDRSPERFAGCTYELYHFPDLGNLYAFTILHQKGVEVDYLDAGLLGDDEAAFMARLVQSPADYYVLHAVVLAKPTDLHWIKKVRAAQPDAWILIHGPEATRVPQEYIGQDPRIVVFRGEVQGPGNHGRAVRDAKELQGHPGPVAGLLDPPLQYHIDAQLAPQRQRVVGPPGVAEDRGGGTNHQLLALGEPRDHRVRQADPERLGVGRAVQEAERKHRHLHDRARAGRRLVAPPQDDPDGN